jgi:hypothetical protein
MNRVLGPVMYFGGLLLQLFMFFLSWFAFQKEANLEKHISGGTKNLFDAKDSKEIYVFPPFTNHIVLYLLVREIVGKKRD